MAKLYAINETGEIFQSIKDAARAVGVDPSNLSKTLTGARRTAGGYSLSVANPNEIITGGLGVGVLQPDIAEARAASAVYGMSKKQVEQRAARRRQSAAKVEERRRREKVTPQMRAAREGARAAMVQANELLRKAKRGEIVLPKEIADDLTALGETIGSGKRSAFNASPEAIKGMREATLNQIEKRINDILQRNQEEREAFNARWVRNFTFSNPDDIDEYQDAMKKYFEALAKVREMMPRVNGRSGYGNIYTDMQTDIQYLQSPEDLEELARILTDFAENAQDQSADALQRIYNDWREEALDGVEDEEMEDDESGGFAWR